MESIIDIWVFPLLTFCFFYHHSSKILLSIT